MEICKYSGFLHRKQMTRATQIRTFNIWLVIIFPIGRDLKMCEVYCSRLNFLSHKSIHLSEQDLQMTVLIRKWWRKFYFTFQLHIAAANGYLEVADFLLDHHVNVDARDNESWQPVHAAAYWSQVVMAEFFFFFFFLFKHYGLSMELMF